MSREIEHLAREKGFTNLTEVAKAMGKAPNTFFSNLRYLMESKSYNSKFAKSLYSTLRINGDEFMNRIQYQQVDQNSSAKKIIDRKASPFIELKPSQENDIINLINSLDEGDIYTLVIQKIPAEFSNIEFKNAILKAAIRGVKFRYLFPIPDAGDNNTHHLINVSTILPDMFNLFIQNLELIHRETGDGDVQDKLDISMAHSGDVVLINPLHSYLCIEQKENGRPIYFVLEEISSGKASTIAGIENAIVWYPLQSTLGIFLAEKINYEFMELSKPNPKKTTRR
jgi:hypothetical protein